jgi:hypothetical protein
MSKQSSRFRISARQGSAIAASLAIAAFGLSAAGCGDDEEENANEAIDSVEQQASEAQKSISTAIDQAEQQATEAQQQADEAQEKAQEQIDQAKQDYGY